MQTKSTQERYKIRALQLIRQAETACGQAPLPAVQIVEWLIERRDIYSKSTWRQYRAALIFWFTQYMEAGGESHEALVDAVARLQHSAPPEGRPEERKTSAQKQKKLSDEDLLRLIHYVEKHPSRHGVATLTWLMAGLWTGLRPCEWETAVLTEDNVLVVQNAKATRHRAHGKTRQIHLSTFAPEELAILKQHVTNVEQVKLDPEQHGRSGFEQYYHHCRSFLYQATRALWPKRQRFISLYSARHQFSANAKYSGLALEQIAALMGHRSTETATAHYGRRAAGNGGLKVIVNPEEVARVRQLNSHRAKQHAHRMKM